MKVHCEWCDKALYRMFVQQGLYSYVEDKERYTDSDGRRMCEYCSYRLLRRGHEFNCPSCDKPVFRLRYDTMRERTITREMLEGIAPQPDPYKGAFIKCRHCRDEIRLWE